MRIETSPGASIAVTNTAPGLANNPDLTASRPYSAHFVGFKALAARPSTLLSA